jgi:outer membrane protein OmpA-like peptidoglycan-associated protein
MFALPAAKARLKATASTRPAPAPWRPAPAIGNQARLRRLPGHLQAKLAVGAVNDPLEHEADRAAREVMRMGQSDVGLSAGPPRLSRKCAECEADESVRAKPDGASPGGGEAPASVSAVLNAPGQALGAAERAFFEPRFGRDFSCVRIHDDAPAARSARDIGARAWTAGADIAFAAGESRNRELLAHELAHVVQQGGPGADTVQRACGPQAIGHPAGCEAGDKSFVSGDIFRFNTNCDEWKDGAEAGLLDFAQTIPATANVEIHGYASTDGPEAFNADLACARAVQAKSWLIAGHIPASRITRLVNHGATPGKAEDRRSVVIRTAGAPAAPVAAPPAQQTPTPSAPKQATPQAPAAQPANPAPATPEKPANPGSSVQLNAQAGVGDVSHLYTTPAGPHDALHEWVVQFMAGYTRQYHADKKSGEERGLFVQAQYSITTKQWTIVGGVQEAYAFALPANLTYTFWSQLTAGSNVTTGSPQIALSVGPQIGWQPADWVTLGAQLGLGPTIQAGAPISIDRTGLLYIQFQVTP